MDTKDKLIENDHKKLDKLGFLLSEYANYIRDRERQPLAAAIIFQVRRWVTENLDELKTEQLEKRLRSK